MNYNSLTDVQKDAVNVAPNVIVAAAAGSGKTAVLVERIIKKLTDKDNRIRADRLLVVTFTNAAAAEMRLRIEKRLDEVLNENPKDKEITEQKLLLQSANICTIDSFCVNFLKENFERCGIHPNFQIADNCTEAKLSNDVLNEIFNRKFEEKDKSFLELLEILCCQFDDGSVKTLITKIYEKSQYFPLPELWINSACEKYTENCFEFWTDLIYKKVNDTLNEIENYNKCGIEIISENPELSNYRNAFEEFRAMINSIKRYCNNKDWDGLYKNLTENCNFVKLKSITGDVLYKDYLKILNNKVKCCISDIKNIVCYDKETLISQLKTLERPVKTLGNLVKEYSENFKKKCIDNNTLTFNLIEHIAFDSICEYKDGAFVLKEHFKDFVGNFDEVMVDEYQDVNDLQDIFFSVISGNSEKLFCVGDVKQSIYGFRGSNQENFQKKKIVPDYKDVTNPLAPKKLILGANFRSRKNICEFINYLFTGTMTTDTAGIDYSDGEMLLPKAKFVNPETVAVDIEIGDFQKDENLSGEANRIAGYINKIMNSGEIIHINNNTEKMRKAKYSDITVLMRKTKTYGPKLANELEKLGIPVSFSKENLLDTVEIITILSLLKVINNPTNDTDLLTLLTSPLFCFTLDDIAKMRIAKRKGSLYSAALRFAKTDEKTNDFIKITEKYRRYASLFNLSKLINHLYNETDIINIMTALSEGSQRKINLIKFSALVSDFEKNNVASLPSFLKYIALLKNNDKNKPKSKNSDDAVTISTIHGSKGLQYPVCILANCSETFNRTGREEYVLNNELGFGFKYLSELSNMQQQTVPSQIIKLYNKQITVFEELRLLYVALTRAEDRLCISINENNLVEKLNGISAVLNSNGKNGYSFCVKNASCYTDIILPMLLTAQNGGKLRNMCILPPENNLDGVELNINTEDYPVNENIIELPEIKNEKTNADDDLKTRLSENVNFVYKYEDLNNIAQKTSVSALVHGDEKFDYGFNEKPSFLSENGFSPTDMGTAVHKVMEHLDFAKAKNSLDAELQRMYEAEIISEEQYNNIDKNLILTFLNSEICGKIISSNLVQREMRFITEIPAQKVLPELSEKYKNEKIIVQGAVDCVFCDNGELIVLDFKTDRVKDEKVLINNYKLQLDIYALACEPIFNLKVKQKVIYSFALGKEIYI